MSIKKLDKLIITNFIGPSILSYFIATFVLVMQFLWKYIDEILGKGFTVLELLELIFYYSITLIPLAVPITMLISSVMVFGDMAEKYELSSMKSAGMSLFRILLPALTVAILVSIYSLFASNYLKPASNLQFQKRFLSLRKQKSALAIEEGIFNDAFGETVIRVEKIENNGKDIKNVLIYDHKQNDKSLISMISAKKGQMYTTNDGDYFVMKLDTGIQYSEGEKKVTLGSNKSEIPFMRTYFDKWTKTFDMSLFDDAEGILNFNRNKEDMMNTFQLLTDIDSFNVKLNNNTTEANSILQKSMTFNYSPPQDMPVKDSLQSNYKDTANNSTKPSSPTALGSRIQNTLGQNTPTTTQYQKYTQPQQSYHEYGQDLKIKIQQTYDFDSISIKHFSASFDSISAKSVLSKAITTLTKNRDAVSSLLTVNKDINKSKQKYLLRLHQQYSWAMICIIFLFIGAPLGSIIRKGGYGYPLLVAILFYMIFIITTILGERLTRNEYVGGIYAAWMPNLVLLPFAILLTVLALRDTKFSIAPFMLKFTSFLKKKLQNP